MSSFEGNYTLSPIPSKVRQAPSEVTDYAYVDLATEQFLLSSSIPQSISNLNGP